MLKGIAVYSPHTALDKAQGGINDWLCEGRLYFGNLGQIVYCCFVLGSSSLHQSGLGAGSVKPVHASQGEPDGTGQGRILELDEPVPVTSLGEHDINCHQFMLLFLAKATLFLF